jgi:hypothetical protein
MVAAIGWQRAVPVDLLAKIAENGDGGPIGAVAKVYLPPMHKSTLGRRAYFPQWQGDGPSPNTRGISSRAPRASPFFSWRKT